MCGPAVHNAAAQIREKVIKLAAHMLEADEQDIVYEDGKAWVRGSPDNSKALQEIAIAGWYGMGPA